MNRSSLGITSLVGALSFLVALGAEAQAQTAVGLRAVNSAGALKEGAPRVPRGGRIAVVVHGINPDHSDLDPLTRDLAGRGYAVVRFVYDDSERLHRSAARLRSALAGLRREANPRALQVVAHSMGGLVARRALTQDPLPAPPESPEAAQGRVPALQGGATLVTIASPFGGFGSANFARLDLGLGRPVYRDLGSGAKFIRQPGQLAPGVTHVKVETDEADKVLPSGASDDTVGQKSQTQSRVDEEARIVYRVDRGHVGAVNQAGRLPGEVRGILTRAFSGRLPAKPVPVAAEPRRRSGGLISGFKKRR